MVKKKSVKKPKKNQQKQSFWVSIKSLSLLKKLIILAVALYVGFIAYNVGVDRYNVSLLNKAEAKMSQLDFPGGEKGEIERYCSERSVKFGSPGKPACGVGHRLEVDYRDNLELEDQTTGYLDVLNNQKVTLLERRTDGINHYYSVGGLSESLDCSLSNVITTDSTDKSLSHVFYLYCQKDFQSRLYPVRD